MYVFVFCKVRVFIILYYTTLYDYKNNVISTLKNNKKSSMNKVKSSSHFSQDIFLSQPIIVDTGARILEVLSDKKNQNINHYRDEQLQCKSHLINLIEITKLAEKDYTFFDYQDRLLLWHQEIEYILETCIFSEDNKMTPLGKTFYAYLDILTLGWTDVLKWTIKTLLIKELQLCDIVYEYTKELSTSPWTIKKIHFQSKKQFVDDINMSTHSEVRWLFFWSTNLSKKLDSEDFIWLIDILGKFNIRNLRFGHNTLHRILESHDLISIAEKAGKSGIRIFNIWGNLLSGSLEIQDLFSLVEIAGKSGIRSLDISDDYFAEKFSVHEILSLVEMAGKSGIRSLQIGWNMLHEIFTVQDFKLLAERAGASWIRMFDFSDGTIPEGLTQQDIFSIVQIAGISGIRSIDLSYNGLAEKWKVSDFLSLVHIAWKAWICDIRLQGDDFSIFTLTDLCNLFIRAWASEIYSINLANTCLSTNIFMLPDMLTLIEKAWVSGIRRLNLSRNWFSHLFQDEEKQKMDNAAKKYHLILDYSH